MESLPFSHLLRMLSPRSQVVSVECPLDRGQQKALEAAGFRFPERLARAVASRRDEFAAGRYCAWQACGDPRVDVGPGGAPAWPEGWVGSIAHSRGRAVAAAARAVGCASIGIDLEPCMSEAQAGEIRSRVLTEADERIVAGLAGWGEGARVTLVFSVKEAIYKCLRPLCAKFFGFKDAELVSLDEAAGEFRFKLARDLGGGFEAGWTGTGRFALEAGWIYTAVELPRLA